MESILSFDTRQELGVLQIVIITCTYDCNDSTVVFNISKLYKCLAITNVKYIILYFCNTPTLIAHKRLT